MNNKTQLIVLETRLGKKQKKIKNNDYLYINLYTS